MVVSYQLFFHFSLFTFHLPTSLQHRPNAHCCPIVVLLLSACCPFYNRTTNGQQADNKRTSVGVISESSGPYTVLITNLLYAKSHISHSVVSADAYGTSQVVYVVSVVTPQSPATDHRLPTTQKYIVHDINLFFLRPPRCAVIHKSYQLILDCWITPQAVD